MAASPGWTSPRPVRVSNFGRNIRFSPARRYRPSGEDEVLRILDHHRDGSVRVVGAGHSWNPGIATAGALLDLRHLNGIRIAGDGSRVTAGAGCRINEILARLAREGLTLPSMGLIARQTVAGAVATGTHGSGRSSMSHYVERLRIACYGRDGNPEVRTVASGEPLRAARCAVGAMGVVLEVTLRCVPQYYVRERSVWRVDLTDVLRTESAAPLQQFYVIPHSWRYLVHERAVAPRNRRSAVAPLYRAYKLIFIDLRFHLKIKLTASLLGSRRLVHFLYRRILPMIVIPRWAVTDRSDRQLLMRHELFRHFEMEIFVRRDHLGPALGLVVDVLRAADDPDHALEHESRARIERMGLNGAFAALRGSYVHHYPICVRRVQPDDTLTSMSSCHGSEAQDWYAISLITYVEPRDPFQRVARLIAAVLGEDFGARLHWGKWFPFGADQVERGYPGLAAFRTCCEDFDPRGVFRNAFLREALFPLGNQRSADLRPDAPPVPPTESASAPLAAPGTGPRAGSTAVPSRSRSRDRRSRYRQTRTRPRSTGSCRSTPARPGSRDR